MQRQLRWVLALAATLMVATPAMAAEPYLSDVVKKPAYARALKNLRDHAGKLPDWTRPRTGWPVESPATHVVIDGIAYDLFWNCESQNCNRSQLTVMFAPNAAQAWGALFQDGEVSYLGAPTAAQQWALRDTLGDRTGK